MNDLYEQLSDEKFEVTLHSLEERTNDHEFSIQNIKGELQSLYKYEGLDGEGRGEVLQAEIEGSILAFEVFIDKYEKENTAF